MIKKTPLKIILAEPRGFCAGVERAIDIVERALEKYGAPVYVRHEIVHNKFVLEDLKNKGAVFIKELNEVPNDRPVIFSAHGVPKEVPAEAESREMIYIDATCPLVSKVHYEAIAHHKNGYEIILIGHAGHAEVVGTLGQLPKGTIHLIEKIEDIRKLKFSKQRKIAYITQTTLSVDDTKDIIQALKEVFPNIITQKKEDICYATTNRQGAIRDIAKDLDAFIIIGSPNSSNSNRLVETAKRYGCPKSFLVDHADDILWDKIKNIKTLGLSAGASAPEKLVQDVIEKAKLLFDVKIEKHILTEEKITFNIPRILAG